MLQRTILLLYGWQSETTPCYSAPSYCCTGGKARPPRVTAHHPTVVRVAKRDHPVLQRTILLLYGWKSETTPCYSAPSSCCTGGKARPPRVPAHHPTVVRVAKRDHPVLQRTILLLYGWQSETTPCYSAPSSCRTGGKARPPRVTAHHPPVVRVAKRDHPVLQRTILLLYGWQSETTPCYSAPSYCRTGGKARPPRVTAHHPPVVRVAKRDHPVLQRTILLLYGWQGETTPCNSAPSSCCTGGKA